MQNSVARAHAVLPPWLPHDLCTPRRASGEPWLACHLQTGFAVDFQRSGAHLPDVLGSHSSVLLTLAKKTEGVEVSELRVDRAVVLSAGSTFAPFHLRPRIRRTSGRSVARTAVLPPCPHGAAAP